MHADSAAAPDVSVIQVLIADDHPLFRSGMSAAIEMADDLHLAGEASDGREAVQMILRLAPDVAVIDLRMPLLDGIKVIELVRSRNERTGFIVLSAFQDSASVFDAVAAGASGYLPKDADRAEVCAAIRAVAAGQNVLPASVQPVLLSEIRLRHRAAEVQLGSRERQVVALTAAGMSAPQIAQQLHIAPSTVKTHLQRIYEKLGVSDRAAMVAEAIRRGLVD